MLDSSLSRVLRFDIRISTIRVLIFFYSVYAVTRAVHVEILDSLRTDSLINAIRRIGARRGAIHQVRSDMGTNLVGADRELREALSGVCHSELQRAAVRQGIDWRFNPPTASHFSLKDRFGHSGKYGCLCRCREA